MKKSQKKQRVLQFSSQLTTLADLRLALHAFLHDMAGTIPGGSNDLLLAVNEAAANAIVHAHGEDGRPIRVRFQLEDEVCRVDIWDTGPGFDQSQTTSTQEEDLWAESGRGRSLMAALTDRVEYTRDEQGNRLTIEKRLDLSTEEEP